MPSEDRGLRLRCTGSSHEPGGLISAAESIGRSEHADATRDLYERYARQVFGFCLSRLGAREEAEDAAQSTFLNAHRALQRGVTPDSELAWLLKIAHNVCLTRRRSTRRRGRVEAAHDIDAMQDYLPAPGSEPADELIRLDAALADLPESQRRAILLREWQGLSYAEIARDLKTTQSAVETLIFRARRSLAANLETAFGRPRVLARVRHALELGWLLPWLRTLLESGAAAKAATAAIAVSSAAVVATSASDAPQRAPASPPARVAVVPHTTPVVERPRLAERELTFHSTEASAATPRAPRTRAATRATPRVGAAGPAEQPALGAKKDKEKVRSARRPKSDHGASAKARPKQRAKPAKVTKPSRVATRPKRKPKKTKPVVQHVPPKAAPAPPVKSAAPEAPTPPEKAKPDAKTK